MSANWDLIRRDGSSVVDENCVDVKSKDTSEVRWYMTSSVGDAQFGMVGGVQVDRVGVIHQTKMVSTLRTKSTPDTRH